MGIFGSYYPPGCSGRPSAPYTVTLQCQNGSCRNYNCKWTATMFDELGGAFFQDDNEAVCKFCGKEGEIVDH